ncbi:MAG TPA: GNAT family N-acetyltransferase [Solirubrobacterales bacterium]|jgi:GNAT superfamily N-acetyltransferase|nr:GNAT family N-acetyltransferase [Solirubrobacterales bacterium]HMW44850.1 GNAT family N-acetyltransferase [Solirubrobacterales bacterium]HMX70554.1 GNAT family N-acetyltransferase [Solirubrobacterales bacterium]HMY27109.1 GNAT family N-acetyltransferase [Solirubrobacterales bacterium]HNA43037.1 GNAT family N-acetyltransferase [Solirubrobacterales bacterium]
MIEIRPVAPGEFPLFEPLFVLYQEFYEVKDIDRGRNREFFSRFLVGEDGVGSADGWLLGAFDGEEAVGFGCFYRHKSSLSATDVVLMNDLFVTEAARGGGTGRALIEAGVELARESGASHLTWATAPDNHTAQRLYDSTGAHKSTWLEYEIEA